LNPTGSFSFILINDNILMVLKSIKNILLKRQERSFIVS